jgi:hypothetical protein
LRRQVVDEVGVQHLARHPALDHPDSEHPPFVKLHGRVQERDAGGGYVPGRQEVRWIERVGVVVEHRGPVAGKPDGFGKSDVSPRAEELPVAVVPWDDGDLCVTGNKHIRQSRLLSDYSRGLPFLLPRQFQAARLSTVSPIGHLWLGGRLVDDRAPSRSGGERRH